MRSRIEPRRRLDVQAFARLIGRSVGLREDLRSTLRVAGRRVRVQRKGAAVKHRCQCRVIPIAILFMSLTLGAPSASATTHHCFGQPATIVGTARADTIYGTTGDDVIYAGGGADVVLGEPLDSNDEPTAPGKA